MRFSPEMRAAFRQLWKKGVPVSEIARLFDTQRSTVYRWLNRTKHRGRESFRDKERRPKESKITVDVEVSILALRNTYGWGTARIRQGLLCLPRRTRDAVNCVQNVRLSRAAINGVLRKHGISGYLSGGRGWHFFRASRPDELWQIDLKGPFRVQGRKLWFLVCIDDYSRYLLLAEQFAHNPTTAEIAGVLEGIGRKPEKILSDNGGQFQKQWKDWCREQCIEPLFAHPYYPQDKGKVERTIRNVSEEFIYQTRRYPEWLNGGLAEYTEWYNHSRLHLGVNAYPADLYGCSVGNFT
jgi:transposase InsO family protein